jgi:hypothetical protein
VCVLIFRGSMTFRVCLRPLIESVILLLISFYLVVVLKSSLGRNNNFTWWCYPRVRKFSTFSTPCTIRNFPFHSTSPLLIFSTCKIRINYWFRIFYFEVVMLLCHPYLCLLVFKRSERMDFFRWVDSLKSQCSHTYSTRKVIILVYFQSRITSRCMIHLKHYFGLFARFCSHFLYLANVLLSYLA